MNQKTITILAVLLGINLTLTAQNFDKQKMDSLFSTIESSGKGMGSVSVFSNGKEVYQKSYGYANLEKGRKIDAATKFRIGSITKTFTATIIMKLIESKKLSLSATLNDFYPQIQNADKITIAHLLQHRSGIANFTSAPDYLQWHGEKQSKEQLLSRIASGGSLFNPDEKFAYSNSNYVLLTFIAEDVTGKNYSQLLQEIIIRPCKLKNTFVGGKINPNTNEAISYSKLTDWKPEAETDMSVPLGAGFITSTPFDLNTFFYCLFNGKLVSAESLKQMTDIKDGFGFGLVQVPFYDQKGFGHTGGIDGFQSNAFYFPDKKVSIALTSNGVVYPLNDIIVGTLSIYFGKEFKLPEFQESLSLTPDELDAYTGVYATSAFPLKLTVRREGNKLIAQGTGQPAFPLECVTKNKFKFDQARLELEFIPTENKMILKQNGATFEMRRE